MSLQTNKCNGIEESLQNTINGSQCILISDKNGNKKSSSTQISPEVFHVASQLTIETCVVPNMQMYPYNNNFKISNEEASGLQEIVGPELEMAENDLCDDAVTNSQSSSSNQYMTPNLSCNSQSSATITDPGWCLQACKRGNSIKSNLPCIEPFSDDHAANIVQKLNSHIANKAHLQKTHHVSGNSLNFTDRSVGIKTHMESLEYAILPHGPELEIKNVGQDSTEHDPSVSALESSVFFSNSYDPILVSDQYLDIFESAGESELTDDVLATYQVPVEMVFNSKDSLEVLSNHQQVVNDVKQALCQTELSQSTRSSLSCSQNPKLNYREIKDCGITNSIDPLLCMKYKPKEMGDEQLVTANEESCEVDHKKPMRVTTGHKYEVETCKKPANSAMNTTFIVLPEANNAGSASEMIDWIDDAQKAGNINEDTFLLFNSTNCENGSIFSQTSTPLPESTKPAFFSSVFLSPTSKTNRRSYSAPARGAPANLELQPNTRVQEQKQCYKVKQNANMKAKLTKVEIKCYPKPNFNYVKPKVVSRIQMNFQPRNVCPSSEPLKNFPRSTSSVTSPQPLCSESSVLKVLNKDRLSKPKSAVLKLSNVALKKTLPTNKESILFAEKISKSGCKGAQTATPSKSDLIDGASSQVHSSLHYSKSSLSSVSATHDLNKTFHCDGRERTNLSKQKVAVIEKPRARCAISAAATDDHRVGLNVPVSVVKAHTPEVILTKSAPSDDQVGRRSSLSNKRSLPMPSQSAKLRVPSSVSKSPLGSVKDGHIGAMQSPANKQLSLSEEQKEASFEVKSKLGSVKTTSNVGAKTGKGIFISKLPVPTSGLKRVNSLSSNSSVLSTCSSKATIASVHHKDVSKEHVLSACANLIQKQSVSVLKNRSASVKTSGKGTWRNVNTPSKILPGSVPRSARNLSTSIKFKADRTWAKSNSSQKASSQTQLSTQALDLHSVERKTPGLHHYKVTCEKQVSLIATLKELLKSSNQKFEAIAIVVQYLLVQKEEVGKQLKELSQELLTLHRELETRSSTCVQLEKDGEELKKIYEEVVQKLSEEHQNELKGLEEKLEQLVNAEKEHLEENFKKDVETLQEQLQKEVESLTSKHEAHKLELVETHAKNLESLERDNQQSLAELTRLHELKQKALEESFKERQLLFEEQVAKLNEENDCLKEDIKIKEIAKAQMQKDQKIDPLILYLEQELESLKAVLEIKNEKIHDQEKKLMQMEKQMEKHIALDEKLKIVLQENEDLKVRMDKHIAVSRQLSTEQVVLQESLQKESKVNKRLSMKNEELLWKLQNGAVLDPNNLSASSSFSFQSSSNSTSPFSGPAPSPR